MAVQFIRPPHIAFVRYTALCIFVRYTVIEFSGNACFEMILVLMVSFLPNKRRLQSVENLSYWYISSFIRNNFFLLFLSPFFFSVTAIDFRYIAAHSSMHYLKSSNFWQVRYRCGSPSRIVVVRNCTVVVHLKRRAGSTRGASHPFGKHGITVRLLLVSHGWSTRADFSQI